MWTYTKLHFVVGNPLPKCYCNKNLDFVINEHCEGIKKFHNPHSYVHLYVLAVLNISN